ncbi:uncharacterized protein LOC111015167 [Momordica charantia]|uniref:Uncharacterized protein LOC111015167 n=1 Tax=Momordica charantia TaxID=3673 RepID=A0A6J1CXF6_MOMCH|nr:uncharacterized protein LOC111015167 [Momordica charantia]XP_022145787.1 uncharacterized protein LOC111015167 [Momordica charantia]
MMESRNGVNKMMVIIPLVWVLVSSAWIFPETVGQKIISSQLDGRDLVQRNDGLETVKEKDDTVRVDPLNHFKKYRGGYNITNKHYWTSTIFTGVAGYGIGVVWLLCGIAYGGFLGATLWCCKGRAKKKMKKMPHCGQKFYLWTILLASFFTILAIVGCGVVIGGSSRFDREAKEVVKIIIETANGASKTIQNTTSAMKDMITNLEASNGNEQTSAILTSTSHQLDAQAANIQWHATKNRHLIHKGLNIVYIVTMVTICLNLGAVIAVLVFWIHRLQRLFHIFILLSWFLTVLCWIFFGLYLFFHNFSSDTCTALEMFQENPNNNSLSSILPCEQLLTAKSVLTGLSSEIYELVNQVNTQIAVSYPDISLVCNPFSAPPYYEYQPQNCAANTIRIGDIPKVLKLLTCSDESSGGGGCENGQFMSNSEYKTVEAYTNSIQDFLNVYPGMESLVECQTVKDAFSNILEHHCKPLDQYAHMVWAGLAFVSVVMVCLVLIWTIKANLEQNLPNSSPPKIMEMASHVEII